MWGTEPDLLVVVETAWMLVLRVEEFFGMMSSMRLDYGKGGSF